VLGLTERKEGRRVSSLIGGEDLFILECSLCQEADGTSVILITTWSTGIVVINAMLLALDYWNYM